jgi:sulfoacetaldehyde acetyltransferase
MNKPVELPAVVTGKQKMTPSEAFVETLVANGVKDVFGIVGSAYMDALDLFPLAGIRFISVAHEQGGGHMADGYSRVSGRHGVCIAQNGPGITNFVTSTAAAYWAHSPVVVITPETGSGTLGLGGFQETEQLPIFSKITKFQAHVNNRARMAELTARAFDRAHLELGPTQLNIPRDFFYGDIECEIPRPIVIERGAGGARSLDAAAELLASARFPVILCGGGVVMADGQATPSGSPELLQAPSPTAISTTIRSSEASLWVGPLGYQGSKAAMTLIAKAMWCCARHAARAVRHVAAIRDGILAERRKDHPSRRRRGKCWASSSRSRWASAATPRRRRRRSRTPCSQDFGVHCEQGCAPREIAATKKGWEAELDGWAHEKDAWSLEVSKNSTYMHPRQMLRELEKAMPEGAMVSTDIGNICSVSNSYLRFNRPRSMLAAMSFGNCGYAFPTVVGAKVAAPDRPAIAYVGDGAWGMSFGEIQTCVRENIPVTAVVFNNGQWGAEKKNHVDFYDNRFVGVNLDRQPSWAKVAQAMGAEGQTIETLADVGPALRAAAKAQGEGKTTILEMMVTRELGDPFRRDALALPTRHLAKYQSTVAKRR